MDLLLPKPRFKVGLPKPGLKKIVLLIVITVKYRIIDYDNSKRMKFLIVLSFNQ